MAIPDQKPSGPGCAECRILLFAGCKQPICAPALKELCSSGLKISRPAKPRAPPQRFDWPSILFLPLATTILQSQPYSNSPQCPIPARAKADNLTCHYLTPYRCVSTCVY